MLKRAVFSILFVFIGYSSAFDMRRVLVRCKACKLGCVIPQEYGAVNAFQSVLFPVGGHPFHFESDFGTTLKPPDGGYRPSNKPVTARLSFVGVHPHLRSVSQNVRH